MRLHEHDAFVLAKAVNDLTDAANAPHAVGGGADIDADVDVVGYTSTARIDGRRIADSISGCRLESVAIDTLGSDVVPLIDQDDNDDAAATTPDSASFLKSCEPESG